MRASLFDVLRGRFDNDVPFNVVPLEDRRLQSVMANLNRLFNTRQNSLEHLPDYGLPEVTTIYDNDAFTIDQLRLMVKETIQKYEPRLGRIYVEYPDPEDRETRITFIITAQLDTGERVKFQTTFASDDLVHVSPWTR